MLRRPLEPGQYTSIAFAETLVLEGIAASIGSVGDAYVGAESLWSTFKHEYYYRHAFAYATELVAAVDNWMNLYNTRRRHSTIGMLSPTNYEQSLTAPIMAA